MAANVHSEDELTAFTNLLVAAHRQHIQVPIRKLLWRPLPRGSDKPQPWVAYVDGTSSLKMVSGTARVVLQFPLHDVEEVFPQPNRQYGNIDAKFPRGFDLPKPDAEPALVVPAYEAATFAPPPMAGLVKPVLINQPQAAPPSPNVSRQPSILSAAAGSPTVAPSGVALVAVAAAASGQSQIQHQDVAFVVDDDELQRPAPLPDVPEDVLAVLRELGEDWYDPALFGATVVDNSRSSTTGADKKAQSQSRRDPEPETVIVHDDAAMTSYFCNLCQDDHDVGDDTVALPCCDNYVCREMILGHINAKMADQDLPAICPLIPLKKCDKMLSQAFCTKLLGDELGKRFDSIQQRIFLQKAGFHFCRWADCPGVMDPADLGRNQSTATCHFVCPENTKHQYCLQCEVPWHDDETCEQYKKRKEAHKSEADQQAQIDAHIKQMGWAKCPQCKNGVERSNGCNAMKCVCGANFCYLCGVLCAKDAHGHFNVEGPCYGKLWEGTGYPAQLPPDRRVRPRGIAQNAAARVGQVAGALVNALGFGGDPVPVAHNRPQQPQRKQKRR